MTGNSNKNNFLSSNRQMILTIVTGGISLGLSFVLAQLRLFRMPLGGSVTPASVLPIVVFGMAFGPAWGFAVSFIFALLQLIGGDLLTPFQVLLDYILGYLALGLAGFASAKKEDRLAMRSPLQRFVRAGLVKGIIMSVAAYLVRWFCSVLSGVIFYGEYAPEGSNVWIYSMTYNGAFLAADMAVMLAVMAVLYFTLKRAYKNR